MSEKNANACEAAVNKLTKIVAWGNHGARCVEAENVNVVSICNFEMKPLPSSRELSGKRRLLLPGVSPRIEFPPPRFL